MQNNKSQVCAAIMANAQEMLEKHVADAGVPESHGVAHCNCVHGHMLKAIASSYRGANAGFTEEQKLALELGALFHEADDRKYFPAGSENAKGFMEKLLQVHDGGEAAALSGHSELIADALRMI